ncbi:hypothetical protein [Parafrankia sp. EAN1pec]
MLAGLFTFFTSMVEQAAARKTVVDLLAASGIDLPVAGAGLPPPSAPA